MIGVAAGVYMVFFRPDPVVIAGRAHMVPLPTPSFSPSAPADTSAFAASLPDATLTYGLRSADQGVMKPVLYWPTRFAEEWHLTYDNGGSGVMTVQAVQHFSVEDATTAYTFLLDQAQAEIAAASGADATPNPEPATSTSPSASPSTPASDGIRMGTVLANGVQVGQSFRVVKDVTETVVDAATGESTEVTTHVAVITWRNDTGVFIMTADPDAIDNLFIEYGV